MKRLFSVLILTLTAATAGGEDAVIEIESIAALNRGEAMTLRLDDREYILRIEPYSVRAPGMAATSYKRESHDFTANHRSTHRLGP